MLANPRDVACCVSVDLLGMIKRRREGGGGELEDEKKRETNRLRAMDIVTESPCNIHSPRPFKISGLAVRASISSLSVWEGGKWGSVVARPWSFAQIGNYMRGVVWGKKDAFATLANDVSISRHVLVTLRNLANCARGGLEKNPCKKGFVSYHGFASLNL